MSLLRAVVLGLTQGLSEFLPISSSGHLLLVPWLFGWQDFAGPGGKELEKAFDVALHVGTSVAVLAYFRRDLGPLARAGLRSARRRVVETAEERLFWLLVISAVPGAITGALLDGFITEHLGAEWLIGLMLVLFGGVLLLADRRPAERPEGEFVRRDALLMGVAQAVALQPGVSRSGVTMSMARWLRFDRSATARLSFLMSVPITGGAVAYKVGKLFLLDGGIPDGFGGAFAVGIVASGISGFAAVAVLIKLLRTRTFAPFVAYRVVAGLAVVALAASSVR
ncbi:MAG: undecaprenyl-diphosphate phosphatase [Acidimicrobiales bacterium]